MGPHRKTSTVSRRSLLGGALGASSLAFMAGTQLAPTLATQEAPSGSVRFPIWFGQADIDAWNQVIDHFSEASPDIEVSFEPLQWEQFWQKLNTQLAAGEAPDATGMHVGLVYTYADKGQLLDLNSLVTRDSFPIDNLFPSLVAEGHWPKGDSPGLYMLPWRFVGTAFYVNKTLLDEKGVPVPSDGWTWDDWLEIAAAVHDDDAGIYGSNRPVAQLHQAQFSQADAFGPLDETLTKSNFLDPGIEEAVQFVADLVLEHKVAPRPEDVPQSTAGVAQDLFLAGKVALHPSATWNIPAYRDVEFEWDVVPQPQHKARGAYSGPDGIGIPTDSENPDAAWEFVKFATSDLQAQAILGATGIPVTKDYALSEEYIGAEAAKRPASYGMLVNELLELGRGYGFNSTWFEWNREVNQIYDQIYNGQVSVQDGLQEMDQKVTEILERGE